MSKWVITQSKANKSSVGTEGQNIFQNIFANEDDNTRYMEKVGDVFGVSAVYALSHCVAKDLRLNPRVKKGIFEGIQDTKEQRKRYPKEVC